MLNTNILAIRVVVDDRILATVVTDGMENSSKECTGKAIKALVDELNAKSWVLPISGQTAISSKP